MLLHYTGYSEKQQQHNAAEVNKRKRRLWVRAGRDPFRGSYHSICHPWKEKPAIIRRRQKETIARDNARVWQQFNAKIYWSCFVSKGRRHHVAGPLYTRSKDLRIMQRQEKKQTAAVKGRGDDVGKRNHPQ